MTASCKLISHKLAVSLIIFLVVLSGVIYLVLLPNTSLNESADTQTPKPARIIEIQTDGSIFDSDPVTPLIQSGDVYTFSGDINGRIDIRKSGITLDGAGYTLRKTGDMDYGIHVQDVDEVSVKNIQIIGYWYAVTLGGSKHRVTEVAITGGDDFNGVGIWVGGSSNIIQGCYIVGNAGHGILVEGGGALIVDNVIADNGNYGIFFQNNPSRLRSNSLNNNAPGPFYMSENNVYTAGKLFRITSDVIDSTNLVEGKPVYYWVNEQDKTVPSNAGYVVLDNCTNIAIEDLHLSWNTTDYGSSHNYAINLIRSDNIVVKNNYLNGTGLWCSPSSQNALICNNNITRGTIYSSGSNVSIRDNSISQSKGNAITVSGTKTTVAQNILVDCETGVSLTCNLAKIMYNTIKECNLGIYLFSANDNTITQNNFIDNQQQVREGHSSGQWPMDQQSYTSVNNIWDRNYWSTYQGIDANSDGIGDTPYVVFENITDLHPFVKSIEPRSAPTQLG